MGSSKVTVVLSLHGAHARSRTVAFALILLSFCHLWALGTQDCCYNGTYHCSDAGSCEDLSQLSTVCAKTQTLGFPLRAFIALGFREEAFCIMICLVCRCCSGLHFGVALLQLHCVWAMLQYSTGAIVLLQLQSVAEVHTHSILHFCSVCRKTSGFI